MPAGAFTKDIIHLNFAKFPYHLFVNLPANKCSSNEWLLQLQKVWLKYHEDVA